MLEDANAAMRKVSDLVSLPKLDVEEKLYYIQKARKKANKTLEHLYDFDSKAASTLDSLDKDMDTMERFVRQMELMAGDGSLDIATYNPKQFVTTEAYRSLEGELIQKAGVKPVKTMRAQDFGGHLSVKFHVYEDGVTVMEYRKQGSKQVYYELVDEIPKEAIPREKKPDDPLYMDIWNGIYEGSGKAVGDTIEGLETLLNPRTYISMGYNGAKYVNQLISSPEETLKSTASRTIDMAKYMGMAVKNAFERDVINGDAKSRTAFFTYAFVFIGLSALGDKGISKISTAGKAMNAGRLAEKAEKLRVNTGVTPALEAAGAEPAKIPYNMMNELGVRLQHATKERWSGDKPGIFNSGTFEHIFRGEVNKKRKAVGYHHESMMGGKIVEVTDPPNQYGVYRAIVEIEGKNKKVPSTFFPKDWNRVQVTEAIKEAYNNKKLIKDNLYEGTLKSGMKIQMRIDPQGKIKTAYPLY
ncbi:EndoU domain-containing protein [Heyndrickxia coagulans]|uniref:EndoU domain-containing protein n=1 Tax=Heyndrickxia coagulans TaxID=1398 RepID=A0AAW7CM40_HEYCO|nr:EndoU domain-containing protein [Heyndrickxia coagulans]MDL5041993.1 EndoU domain-containing protein [Heyndrickxia coagulans]